MTDALTRLADAVEAGTATEADFDAAWPHAMYGEHHYAKEAYNGSLDAAHKLHLKTLGDGYVGNGWLYCIWGSGKASVWEIISGKQARGEVSAKHHHSVCAARAWLLAILRALAQVQK